MAIHGNSTDPVLVKKISLRMWKLRDEIEAVIEEKSSESESQDIGKIKNEYSADIISSKVEEDMSAEDTETSEDPGAEEAAELEASEANEEGEEETTAEADVLEMPGQGGEGETVIKQRRPQISQDKIINGISILRLRP